MIVVPMVSAQDEARALSSRFRAAAKQVSPSVVTIHTSGGSRPAGALPFDPRFRPGPPEEPDLPRGASGVVINAAKGYVLTNDHVVQGDPKITVILPDGRERSVSQVRRDPKSDLAVLMIDPNGLAQAEWGDSSTLDIGDWVLAVGQPFGLSGTVTAGIISGKGRGIGVAMYEDLIQTDAAINPGNSGGPLIDLDGRVVGINTAIHSVGGGYEGIGFAIPSQRARRVTSDLMEHGRVLRSYLGIQIGPVDQQRGEQIEQVQAVQVKGVNPDSPASEAGLKEGDAILRVNGEPVEGVTYLQSLIEFAEADRPLSLQIDRDGERKEVEIVPKAQPENFGLRGPIDRPIRPDVPAPRGRVPGGEPPLELQPGQGAGAYRLPREGRSPRSGFGREAPFFDMPQPIETRYRAETRFPKLGLRVGEIVDQPARRKSSASQGVLIVSVERGGRADRGGLEPGMLITRVGTLEVTKLNQFRQAVERSGRDEDLVVQILRGSKEEVRLIPRRNDASSDSGLEVEGQQQRPGSQGNEPGSAAIRD